MNPSPLSVEVDIQDACSESSNLDAGDPGRSPHCNPIALEVWEHWFHQWLEALKPTYSPINAYELSLRLTHDAEIQELNAQYRQKNQPTDVLAFAALEVDYPQPDDMQWSLPTYLGDLVISIETAARQAEEQGHSLQTELAWLAAHGLLHLLGWDHPDDEHLVKMLAKQETLLGIVGLSL